MLVILVVMGVATQVFMSSSSIETDGSKNITDMANRTVTIPMMWIVLYLLHRL